MKPEQQLQITGIFRSLNTLFTCDIINLNNQTVLCFSSFCTFEILTPNFVRLQKHQFQTCDRIRTMMIIPASLIHPYQRTFWDAFV
jgi:hypothetical protein